MELYLVELITERQERLFPVHSKKGFTTKQFFYLLKIFLKSRSYGQKPQLRIKVAATDLSAVLNTTHYE